MFPTILSLFFDFPWVSEVSTFSLSQIFNHWFPSVSASLYFFYQSPKHYNSSHWWSVQTRIVIVRCSSVFSLVYTPNSGTLTLNYRLFIHVQVWWGYVAQNLLFLDLHEPRPPPPKKKKKKKKKEVCSMFFWQPFCSFSISGREWNGGGYISF